MQKIINSFEAWKKRTFPKEKKTGEMKILKTRDEKFAVMDVEMDDVFINNLLQYAEKNIPKKEKENLLVNWAFEDILGKAVKKSKIKK